jgi:hypothetical protein
MQNRLGMFLHVKVTTVPSLFPCGYRWYLSVGAALMIRLPFALALLGSLPHLAAARQTLGLGTGNKKPNQ